MTLIKNLKSNLPIIGKVLIIPCVVGLLCWLFGGPILKISVVSLLLQFPIFYILNSRASVKIATELEKENIKAIEMINTNYVLVDCQRCKGQNNVKVLIAEDNVFECQHCKAKNRISLDLSVALMTDIPNNADTK